MTTSRPAARVLGKLLILQQNLEILPTREEQAKFTRRALQEVPGLADVVFCFPDRPFPECPSHATTRCALAYSSEPPTPDFVSRRCCANECPDTQAIPFQTATRRHGFMILVIADPAALAPYAPYLVNIANSFANLLEKQAMNAELQRMLHSLRAADRRKDEFLAMLGHELRNPLAPIRNATQILRIRARGVADCERPIEIIERQVNHLTQLVDDLLDVSRITRGKITLQKQPVNLTTVIHRAVEVNQPLIEAHRHQLAVHFSPCHLTVHGDEVRLVQVLANLLNNAAKYSEDGGRIEVSLEQDVDTAVLKVRDTGMGITAEMLPHIFDLFSQGERGLDRAQGGLGIGLSLVKGLVEMHGGQVEAHSKGVGQGSEFLVRLPLLAHPAEAPPAPNGARFSMKAARTTPHQVLVVDDNHDAAESMAALLSAWGYDTRTAHDGKAAVETCRAYQPDVILLDIGLPGMNGYEVARHLREDCAWKPRALIALTGYGQAEDRARAFAAGFDHHFVKPVDTNDLAALLTSLCPN